MTSLSDHLFGQIFISVSSWFAGHFTAGAAADGGSGGAAARAGGRHAIRRAGEQDLGELLPLMRAYCDFYRVAPADEALLALARALIEDPEREGLQLIARDPGGAASGFATVYWSWSTAAAARIGVMNDLYVAEQARGSGLADRLIAACAEECRRRGAVALEWQTAPENRRAQAVYDRVGGRREAWITYTLPIGPAS